MMFRLVAMMTFSLASWSFAQETPRSPEALARFPQAVQVGSLAGRPVLENRLNQRVLGRVDAVTRDDAGAPQAPVICVSGDGSFLMNVQELATVARYRLPVKIVLLDNQALGMVRQWQELFFERRYSEVDLSDNPDFCALALAFGIQAMKVDRADDVEAALQALMAASGPMLLHVAIDQTANVWPLVPPNRNNTEMMDADEAFVLVQIAEPLLASSSHDTAGAVHQCAIDSI